MRNHSSIWTKILTLTLNREAWIVDESEIKAFDCEWCSQHFSSIIAFEIPFWYQRLSRSTLKIKINDGKNRIVDEIVRNLISFEFCFHP